MCKRIYSNLLERPSLTLSIAGVILVIEMIVVVIIIITRPLPVGLGWIVGPYYFYGEYICGVSERLAMRL